MYESFNFESTMTGFRYDFLMVYFLNYRIGN